MKKNILFTMGVVCLALLARAQNGQQPVQWKYQAKKTGENTYEIRFTATIDPGWHIYAQKQPDNAEAFPTHISFSNNPLVSLDGITHEKGELHKVENETLSLTQMQYENQVVFVQRVKLKRNVSTNISGEIAFQACTEQSCLPPDTQMFMLKLL